MPVPVVVSNFNYFYHRDTETQFLEDEENEDVAATEGAAVGRGSSCRALRDGSGNDGDWTSGEKNEEAKESNELHSSLHHHSNQQSGNGKALTPTGLITTLAAGLLVGTSSGEKDSSASHTHSARSAHSHSHSASAVEHQNIQIQENGEKNGCRGSNELFLQKESTDREVENSELGRLLGSGPVAPLTSPGVGEESNRLDDDSEQRQDSRQHKRRRTLCMRSVSQPFGPSNTDAETLELGVQEPNRSRSPSCTHSRVSGPGADADTKSQSSKSIKFDIDDFALHEAGRSNSHNCLTGVQSDRPHSLHSAGGRGSQKSHSAKHSQSSYGDSEELVSQEANSNSNSNAARTRSDSLSRSSQGRHHKTSHASSHTSSHPRPHVEVKPDPLAGRATHSIGPPPPPPAIRRHIIERHRRATVHTKSGRAHDCKL